MNIKQEIICGDCLTELKARPGESVDIVVTSPPYNINTYYNFYIDNKVDYLEWMADITKEIKRVLKKNGSFFLNIGGTNANPAAPWYLYEAIGNTFLLQNQIIWVKNISIGEDSFGHFKPINSDRYLNNNYEVIFHLTKFCSNKIDRLAVGVPYKHKSNIERWGDGSKPKVDKRCAGNVWFIPYKTVTKQKDHPAGFPLELPMRCIKLHGYDENTIVLDPFLGAGTTLLACKALGVNGIGIELDQHYCDLAAEKLNLFSNLSS